MKRLTIRLGDGQAVMDCDTCVRNGSVCTVLACRNRLKDRVCDYEDVMQQNRLVEQKRGRWDIDKSFMPFVCTCSRCGAFYREDGAFEWRYCPTCGAKMDMED